MLSVISIKWGALFLLIYPLQVIRLARRNSTKEKKAWIMAFFLVLGKFPEMLGQIEFFWRLYNGRQGQLIEYK